MIYIEQIAKPQTLHIPRNLVVLPKGTYVFSIENTVNKTRIAARPSSVTPGTLYYSIQVEFDDSIPTGEYRYELTKGGCLLASGLLVAGDYTSLREGYNTPIHYQQYEQ